MRVHSQRIALARIFVRVQNPAPVSALRSAPRSVQAAPLCAASAFAETSAAYSTRFEPGCTAPHPYGADPFASRETGALGVTGI